jgi:hypothetical protein
MQAPMLVWAHSGPNRNPVLIVGAEPETTTDIATAPRTAIGRIIW